MGEEFENGDVVQLKSGGPWMTVDRVTWPGERVHCLWFDSEGGCHEREFLVLTLKKRP